MEEYEVGYPEEEDNKEQDDEEQDDEEQDDDSDYSGVTENRNEKRTLKTGLRRDKLKTNVDTAEKSGLAEKSDTTEKSNKEVELSETSN